MKKSPAKVLVVTSYTKRIGFAVFDRKELLYFAVTTFRRPRTVESIGTETTEKLKGLLDQFKPELVITKSMTKHQSESNKHRQVIMVIRDFTEIASVQVKTVSYGAAQRKLVKVNTPTKSQTFAVVRNRYPELTRFTKFQNRSQEEYYTPMLAAIAIGLSLVGRNPNGGEYPNTKT